MILQVQMSGDELSKKKRQAKFLFAFQLISSNISGYTVENRNEAE